MEGAFFLFKVVVLDVFLLFEFQSQFLWFFIRVCFFQFRIKQLGDMVKMGLEGIGVLFVWDFIGLYFLVRQCFFCQISVFLILRVFCDFQQGQQLGFAGKGRERDTVQLFGISLGEFSIELFWILINKQFIGDIIRVFLV